VEFPDSKNLTMYDVAPGTEFHDTEIEVAPDVYAAIVTPVGELGAVVILLLLSWKAEDPMELLAETDA